MAEQIVMEDARDHERVYLTLIRPRCPDCRSPRLLAYRTVDNGDNTSTRYCRCGNCGRGKIVIVLE